MMSPSYISLPFLSYKMLMWCSMSSTSFSRNDAMLFMRSAAILFVLNTIGLKCGGVSIDVISPFRFNMVGSLSVITVAVDFPALFA